MTLNYSAKITVDAKDKTTAIYDSVKIGRATCRERV